MGSEEIYDPGRNESVAGQAESTKKNSCEGWDESDSGQWGYILAARHGEEAAVGNESVSYTHLTLPTNREV